MSSRIQIDWRSDPIAREPWLRPSTRYGLHLSKEQVAELVMPHPHTLELVKSWLKYHGVPMSISMTHGGNWLTLTGISASKASDLLGTSYQLYRHAETKDIIIHRGANDVLRLPAHVVADTEKTIWWGGSGAGESNIRRSRDGAVGTRWLRGRTAVPALGVTYNSASYVPAATDRNVLGIVGYAEEYPNPVDLTKFMDQFRVPETSQQRWIRPEQLGLEANMNVQYTSRPVPLLGQLHARPRRRRHPTDDQYVDYARAVCDLFTQLGPRGVSALFSSGIAGLAAFAIVGTPEQTLAIAFPIPIHYQNSNQNNASPSEAKARTGARTKRTILAWRSSAPTPCCLITPDACAAHARGVSLPRMKPEGAASTHGGPLAREFHDTIEASTGRISANHLLLIAAPLRGW
ncbi:hypothetical protein EDB85DRAFT_2279538 [Lactarius pseudohatsudake]|nr:hypothetical protein EDB85DRAFT_2279538 [Lactarius pseudohatsudake]